MRRLLTLALLWSLTSLGARAGLSVTQARETFEQANREYLDGHFERAEDLYRQLIAICPQDPVLYFNLGNTCDRLGKRGWAVWCFEKALLLRPGWAEARHNLSLVQPAAPPAESVMVKPFLWARDSVAPQIWSWLTVGCWAVFLLAAGIAVLLGPSGQRRALWRLTALAGVLMIFGLVALALQHAERQTHPPSIVVADSAAVRSGAGPDAGSRMGSLPAGTRVWPMDQPSDSGWVKIRTESGQLGFVDQSTLQDLAI
jgi:tetratricopeptide (TPR) repeat protein